MGFSSIHLFISQKLWFFLEFICSSRRSYGFLFNSLNFVRLAEVMGKLVHLTEVMLFFFKSTHLKRHVGYDSYENFQNIFFAH